MLVTHRMARKTKTMVCRVNSGGFTILELMIATAIFAIILLVVTTGIITFSHQYFKGVVSSRTQATTRSIMNEVAQSIQFGGNTTIGLSNSPASGICVDGKAFSYVIGQQVSVAPKAPLHQSYHGLVVGPATGDCTASSITVPKAAKLGAGQRELLGEHMRLSVLDITNTANLYKIHVRVIYGDDDLLTNTSNFDTASCAGNTAGSQFCAVSDLTTTVQKRL